MLTIYKKLQLIALGAGCSLVVALLINVFFVGVLPSRWDLAKNLDDFFYNTFFQPTLQPAARLVIIDCDDAEGKRSRAEYAEMIEALGNAGAKCLALDIYFYGEKDSLGDRALAQSVEKWPQVILAADFSGAQKPPTVMSNLAEQLSLSDSVCETVFLNKQLAEGASLPFAKLLSAAKHLGHINSWQNEAHHFLPVIAFNRKCYLALPIQIARLALAPADETQWLKEIPLDKYGQILVNFIPLEKFRYPIPWNDVKAVLQDSSVASFQDAVVLMVNPAAETELQTPLGKYPRWALLASLISQLLQNRHVEASDVFYPAVFSATLVWFGLLWFLFLAPRLHQQRQKTLYLYIGGNLITVLFVFLTLRFWQQWVGVAAPLAAFNLSLTFVRARYYQLIKPALYVDFGLAILERQGRNYPIQVLTSPAGEEEANITLSDFFVEAAFQEKLQKLKALTAVPADMKAVGDKLFQALFQNEIQNIFKRSLDYVANEKKCLRLNLRIEAPELSCLPWELLHNAKMTPGFIALHQSLSLARYIPLEQPVKKADFRVPLNILVFISSPPGRPGLDVAGEKKLLHKALRPFVWGGDICLRFCANATLDSLREELARDPDILHYIGHGHFDTEKKEAFLDFEAVTGDPDPVDVETLGSLLHESSLKLVVLNSCEGATAADTDAFTGVAQNLVRAGVPAVVAMQYPIFDQTAVMFSSVFYANFIKNYSVDAAVAEARRQIMAKTRTEAGQQSWATPVFFMRAPHGKIFDFEGEQ